MTLSTTPISSPLAPAETKSTGALLQEALTDLIDLSLIAKQAHWNVVGRNFRSAHLQLDELVTLSRGQMDEVAERAAALGISPDGRARTVSTDSALPDFGEGYRNDRETVAAIVSTLDTAAGRMRSRIESAGKTDPVTEDMFIQITKDLEQIRWMFQAQLADH
ncbi:DNA starvation/stationary phase protection protein [Pseudonocardiaceae bacterium YIM PH 21723]|nr:DNA starvation/stationary phase protection protein [Pseudonocardiaceae bacterium YIM PH 21723]